MRAHVAIRGLLSVLVAVLTPACMSLQTAMAAPLEPSIVIGLNGGSGLGEADSVKFHERGFTSERIEAGGPSTQIAESTSAGWTDDVVIVGNTSDSQPLSAVNVSEWTSKALAQIKEAAGYGATLFEVGNEMYLKGQCGEGCYQQKEPAKYAEMFVSLSKAVEGAGITGVKLLFNSFGDYEESNGGPWSQVCCGGGWLATAEKAQPELRKRVGGFTMHPYGEAGENVANDDGPGALKVQHEQAVSLGFENTSYYATEFGVQLEVAGKTGSSSPANQAEKIKAVYNELVGDSYVKGIWYYKTADDSTGKWGLIEKGESFVPRPALETVSSYALTYEGPTTEAATGVSAIGASLHGSINPEGKETHYHFEYGTTTSYGSSVPATEPSIGSGSSGLAVSQSVASLQPNTTYHYRLVAKRGTWSIWGVDKTFTTKAVAWSIKTSASPGKINSLASVSCSAASSCFAVGSGENLTLAETLSGAEWKTQVTPNPAHALSAHLFGVSCTSSSSCYAVGEALVEGAESYSLLAEKYNGSEWTLLSLPAPSGAEASVLRAISCSSSSACTAVGDYTESSESGIYLPFAERWNGSTWKVQSVPAPVGAKNTVLQGVSCSSASACLAVGYHDGVLLAESWNATSWEIKTTPAPSGAKNSYLRSVSCTSAEACTAVGEYAPETTEIAFAERWNGSEWSPQAVPPPGLVGVASLSSVACTTSSSCTAVGSYKPEIGVSTPLAEYWNGKEWLTQTSAAPSESEGSLLSGVSCLTAETCRAAGNNRTSPSTIHTLVESTS